MKKLTLSLFCILLIVGLSVPVLAQEEEMGTAEDLLPTEEEIAAAQEALGDSVVGIISCTMGNEWHATAAQAAADRLEEMSLTAEIFDSQADTEVQISGIESFTSRGVGALIICVLDPPAVENALQEAADAGIAIVQYAGRESAQAFGGISIAIEDADLGWAAGEYAGQLITEELGGEAEVVILDYPDLPNVVLRADNIEAALLENAPDANIVGRFLGGTPDNGLTSMENALQAFPDVNVVVSINDAGAYGALQALEAAGKGPEDVIVVGIDAEDQALQYLADGYFFRGTVSTAPASNGALAADAVVKLLAGADAPANVRVPIELITAEEEMGTAEDLLPTEEEIAAAQEALGDSVVGIISCTMGNEWHATAAQAAADHLEEMGLTAEIFDSQADTEVQISGIESFTSRGVSALIICVLDPPAVENALQEASDAGIAIVQYAGRESAQAFGGISIAIEDADLGWAAGEYAGQLITEELGGEAEVVILDYPDLPNVVLRADNIEAALLENAPDANIVGRFLGGTPDNGLTSMENALQAFPDVNVVVSINDAGAYGALQALEAAGKGPEDVIVVGIDAEDQALQYLADGYFFRGTVSTAPASNGALAADAVVKLLAGADAPANVRVPIELITADTLPE